MGISLQKMYAKIIGAVCNNAIYRSDLIECGGDICTEEKITFSLLN